MAFNFGRFLTWRWLAIPAVLAALCIVACGGQPLEPWHKARLQAEYTARNADEITSLADYLALEQRLFEELYDQVYSEVPTGEAHALNRYSSGSVSDPRTRQPDYNRTFELPVDNPRGGVLLLHGLTDSPYSLRATGAKLHELGFHVVGLRLPGHGTVPAALKKSRWQDWAAAARLAMDHLADTVGDRPIHVAGYSTGAALALDLAIAALDDGEAVTPASLILVSPAIGVTRAAALAGAGATLGRIPGFGRLGWSQTTPEFDPYKYNSFPTNAGSQVHKLTRHVSRLVGRLESSGRAAELPPVLVFKSAVDATVSTSAVVDRLLARLPDNGNELVLFDINRSAIASPILVTDPGPFTNRLVGDATLPFGLRLIANENASSIAMVEHYKPPFSEGFAATRPLELSWPRGVISLSHVALPFPPDDPLYGAIRPEDPGQLYLGQLDIRGERGLLRLSSNWLLRLRHNPFYAVQERRIVHWVETHAR
ncbi:MAG: alpha/beta fold hydrolase [Woeseiaceae bacterium]|nr:alpha/beta fold hydrolase [Woeseiaceae bacterium]